MTITYYSESEFTGEKATVPMLAEKVMFVRHERNPKQNRAVVVEYLKTLKDEQVPTTKGYSYNHYASYQRIYCAITKYCLGKTKLEIGGWLFGKDMELKWSGINFNNIINGFSSAVAQQALVVPDAAVPCVVTALGIKPSPKTVQLLESVGHPAFSVLAWDTWVDWAINAVLDYPENIYYGKGTGDGAGTKLDTPNLDAFKAAQIKRVTAALDKLATVIPGLSKEPTVTVDEFDKIYTIIGQKALGDLANVSMQSKTLLGKRGPAIENIDQQIAAERIAKKPNLSLTEFTPEVVQTETDESI